MLNRKFTNMWLGISDVCFGYWTDWGSDQPSLPYKSHKTINLTSANSTLIGHPEQYVSINTTSPVETMVKTQVNGQPANVSQDRTIMNVVDCGKSISLAVLVVVAF